MVDLALAVPTALLVLILVLAPFFLRGPTRLQHGSALKSREELLRMKEAILRRYMADEKAARDAGQLGRLTWPQRRLFLVNRYIDTVRRLDFIDGQEAAE